MADADGQEPLLSQVDYNDDNFEVPGSGADRAVVYSKSSTSSWIAESLEKGRARSSVLSMVSCALGTGVLTLPSAFSESGLLIGILITLIAATVNG